MEGKNEELNFWTYRYFFLSQTSKKKKKTKENISEVDSLEDITK